MLGKDYKIHPNSIQYIIMPCLLFNKDGVTGSVDIKILPAKKDRKLTRETKVSVLPFVKSVGLTHRSQVAGYRLHALRDRDSLLYLLGERREGTSAHSHLISYHVCTNYVNKHMRHASCEMSTNHLNSQVFSVKW